MPDRKIPGSRKIPVVRETFYRASAIVLGFHIHCGDVLTSPVLELLRKSTPCPTHAPQAQKSMLRGARSPKTERHRRRENKNFRVKPKVHPRLYSFFK